MLWVSRVLHFCVDWRDCLTASLVFLLFWHVQGGRARQSWTDGQGTMGGGYTRCALCGLHTASVDLASPFPLPVSSLCLNWRKAQERHLGWVTRTRCDGLGLAITRIDGRMGWMTICFLGPHRYISPHFFHSMIRHHGLRDGPESPWLCIGWATLSAATRDFFVSSAGRVTNEALLLSYTSLPP